MKFILLLSLISFSSLSFSSENVSRTDVLQAIKDSLATKDLDCIQSNQTASVKASSLDTSVLENPLYIMTINEAEQPVITFFGTDETIEVVTSFTTNSDLTVVERINTVSSTLTKTKINTGTITKPHFEERIVKKIDMTMECK